MEAVANDVDSPRSEVTDAEDAAYGGRGEVGSYGEGGVLEGEPKGELQHAVLERGYADGEDDGGGFGGLEGNGDVFEVDGAVEGSEDGSFEGGGEGSEGEADGELQREGVPAENGLGAASVPSGPAGLGSSSPLEGPGPRDTSQQPKVNGSTARRQAPSSEDATVSAELEELDETRRKLQGIRVNFIRLARRLGQTSHNVVVAQVLYRLGLAEQLRSGASRTGAISFDRASALAEQLEAAGQELLDFSCTILVIGKTGVGKSATINSIFDESRFRTDAFSLGTRKVQCMVGLVQGIKVRVIDTPGLLPSWSDQWKNEKILKLVKEFIKKTPPDVIMYLDRLDMQNRDLGDIPLLRTITDVFGPSIWFNVIVVLTHASSAPPEGANGIPMSYEMYVSQRTHVIQSAIHHAAGDQRLMNPVSLVENHSACRTNRAGQRVLPNGQVWKPHLLLLSFASKVLAEANALLKLQDSQESSPGRPFRARSRAPPLPFFLSSLLQSKPLLKLLQDEQYGDIDSFDMDLDEESDSGNETDYDDLPPFKNLTKEQVSKLSKDQKRAYFEELDYRERLFYRKQMKEERKHRKQLKKMAEATVKEQPHDSSKEHSEEVGHVGPASPPELVPDSTLPASFDSDHPSYRYRVPASSQWLVRPAVESQGWDHDVGYDGLTVEKMFVVKDNIPISFSGQLMKDKRECALQMELATLMKPREGLVTSCGVDVQSIGKDVAYTIHGETRVKNLKRNSLVAGVSASFLGDTSSIGLKVEDRLVVNKWLGMLVNGGMMAGHGDVSYGGRFEVTLKDKDGPIGRLLSTLALSMVDWHGELALTGNAQCQIPIGRGTNMAGHVNFTGKGDGQVSIRVNSSKHLNIAILALFPLFMHAKRLLLGPSESA